MESIAVYRFFVWHLLQPYTLSLIVIGLVLLRAWWKRRESRRRLLGLTVPFLLLVVLSTPAVAYLALGSLEWHYPPAGPRPAGTEVIVVLASGAIPPDALRLRAELDEDGRNRCLHAAELYRQGPPCLILVSGGSSDPRGDDPRPADVMRDFLVEVGVSPADILVENQSRTTHENAVACAGLLEERSLHEIVLVTDAVDMYRAWRCFRKQGVEAVPSPCHHRATHFRARPEAFLPIPEAARDCQRVCHEWLGLGWYWFRDRL